MRGDYGTGGDVIGWLPYRTSLTQTMARSDIRLDLRTIGMGRAASAAESVTTA